MDVEFFFEMAWKSGLIAGTTLLLAQGLRSRSAADRALVLRTGVLMLLLLPPVALFLPVLEVVAFPAPDPTPLVALEAGLPDVSGGAAANEATLWDDPTPLLLLAYLGGMAMAGLRLVGGLVTLARWTRRATEVDCPHWKAALERVRWTVPDPDRVRLLVADEVRSPLSWGWRHPVILIDPDSLRLADDADAILAHEAAHIARRDWPALILSRLVAILFWFNPLVWLLEREVVQQSEVAADIEAAERVEPVRYAETLLGCARANLPLPANSMASGGSLGRRVLQVLDRNQRERPSGSAWTAMAMLLCLGLAAPVAAMQLVAAQPDPIHPSALGPAVGVTAIPPSPKASPHPVPPSGTAETSPGEGRPNHAGEALAAGLAGLDRARQALAGLDKEAVEPERRAAEQESRAVSRIHRREWAEALAEAREEIVREQAHAQAEIAMARRERLNPLGRRIDEQVRRSLATAMGAVTAAMPRAAAGMEEGALGMERGARKMESEARRLRDPAHRERLIAQARARGEVVTHDELLKAAEGLRTGAEGLRDGARDLRESAREMADGQVG